MPAPCDENSTTGHVTGQKSRESSHTSVSRASAKNSQGNPDLPRQAESINSINPEQSHVFKSPQRSARSRNVSSNVNSAKSQNKTEISTGAKPKSRSASTRRKSVSQSTDRARRDRSLSKNKVGQKPNPNIDKVENQKDQNMGAYR